MAHGMMGCTVAPALTLYGPQEKYAYYQYRKPINIQTNWGRLKMG
jgi:hypothetical protein